MNELSLTEMKVVAVVMGIAFSTMIYFNMLALFSLIPR